MTNDCQRYVGSVAATDTEYLRDTNEEKSMSKPTRFDHPIYSLLPTEIDGFDSLVELALLFQQRIYVE
jgi:hypothetical protein